MSIEVLPDEGADTMTWFKVDDGLHGSMKARRAGEAMALWVMAGSWCADQLTDGWVPEDIAQMLAPKSWRKWAAKLVQVGLWEAEQRDDEAGWQFHDWSSYQPTKTQVLADRASNTRRQALVRNPELREAVRRRDQDRCRYCALRVRWQDRRGSEGGTYDHVDPNGPNTLENLVVCCRGCNSAKANRTPAEAGMVLLPVPMPTPPGNGRPRSDSDTHLGADLDDFKGVRHPIPDPTRPDLEEQHPPVVPPRGQRAAAAGDARRGTRLPEDFAVTDEMKAWAREHTPLCGTRDHEMFMNHWLAQTGQRAVKRDWLRTWRNWMYRAQDNYERRGRPAPSRSTTDERVAGALEAGRRLQAIHDQKAVGQ